MTKTSTFLLKCYGLFLLAFILSMPTHAQKELWGTVANGGDNGYGFIYKTNASGDDLEIKYHFDSITGKNPAGRFISDGNGKLYGLTAGGGSSPHTGVYSGGVLYEYDMRTDSLHVLYNFNTSNPDFPHEGVDAYFGMIRSAPGIFHGMTSSGKYVFKFNASTNVMQLAITVPSFIGGSAATNQPNGIKGPLFKAADGFLYGSTYAYSQCPIAFPNAGSVIRINPTTNAFSLIYPYGCTGLGGWNPNGDFVQVGGKLYSTNEWGGLYGASATSPGNGTIYEFNPVGNVYTKKYDFDGLTGFRPTTGMVLADNGKLYGTTTGGGAPYGPYPNGSGVLFEFDPVSGAFSKKHDFTHISGAPDTSLGIYPRGTSLIKASNGKLYGQTIFGIYEYDVTSNTLRVAGRYPAIDPAFPSLMETCRPPSYRYFTDSTFSICQGSPFVFDLHNDNAVGVVWLHNGIADPAQTGTILEFTSISLADAGTWKCIMTNECGITKPFALHITVNPSSGSTVSSVLTPAGTTMICPGTSITLSGNNGGVWNTGSTSASITVSQPGSYQVINANSCGSFYSNIVVVDTIASPANMVISVPNTYICYGQTVTISGNVAGGVWNNGSTLPTLSITADSTTIHYTTLTHTCGTDTSNMLTIPGYMFYKNDPLPVVAALGPVHFCDGDNVMLSSNKPSGSLWTWEWMWYNGSSTSWVGSGASCNATLPGYYFIRQTSFCNGTLYSDSIYVSVDFGPPPAPGNYSSDLPTFCEGDSAVLQTNIAGGIWSNGDTALTITAFTSGDYFYTVTNACGSTESPHIIINMVPAPVISWTQMPNVFCVSTTSVTLSAPSPLGGLFSGPGVSGGMFDPAVAGTGIHDLFYSYYDISTGCNATATQTVTVDTLPSATSILNNVSIGSDSATICQGDSILILPMPYSPGIWNDGETNPVYFTSVAGVYNFTVINTCGSTVSNDFTLFVDPGPGLAVLQSGAQLTADPGYMYQWIDCGNAGIALPGETSQVFTATANGTYAAVLSTSTGCTDTTACYAVNTLSLAEHTGENTFSFYPNPAGDLIFIECKNKITGIKIMDMTGKVLMVTGTTPVNLSNISRGTYLLEVETGHQTMRKSFVKL